MAIRWAMGRLLLGSALAYYAKRAVRLVSEKEYKSGGWYHIMAMIILDHSMYDIARIVLIELPRDVCPLRFFMVIYFSQLSCYELTVSTVAVERSTWNRYE